MVDIEGINGVLDEIKKLKGISSAILVSRTGTHLAGDLPEGAHAETFVAMFAILLGAAETATSELREGLSSICICLETSKVMVVSDGPKALYVLTAAMDVKEDKIVKELEKRNERLREYL